MGKYSLDEILRNAEIVKKYEERFGEEALPPYVEDMSETAKELEKCLEAGKTYEELYGVFPKDVDY